MNGVGKRVGKRIANRFEKRFGWCLAACLCVVALPSRPTEAAGPPPGRGPIVIGGRAAYCSGEYADELSVLAPHTREFERDPQNQYSYCLRTTAVYECLSYAPDGSIHRSRRTAFAHGTGFAYRRQNGETFLITNEHVAGWPAVTDDQHSVEDVPNGCKLVSDSIKVVDNEEDGYDTNDLQLTRVVSDPSLDIAVLKTRAPLHVMPYRIGRSAALHVGNAVAAHGFPLGAFAATNAGKVVNAYDHDLERDWDHADFVVDALLSPGNSGSPVLAVSCKTGEYELVGVYHAGYTRGSALNVVVGIDQVRELMTTLKRTPHAPDAATAVAQADRQVVQRTFGGPDASPFFPFGPLVAAARVLPSGVISIEVYSRGFPLHDERLLVLEDLPSEKGFGDSGRLYVGNSRGLRAWERSGLDAEAQAQLAKIVARLRLGAVNTARHRMADPSTSKGFKERQSLERAVARQASIDRDAAQALVEIAERLGPRPGDKLVTYRDAILPLPGAPNSSPVPPPVADQMGSSPRPSVP